MVKNSGLPTGSGLRCWPSARSWSTIGRKTGSPSQSRTGRPATRRTGRQRPPAGGRPAAAPGGLGQGLLPVRWVDQVVQRPEEEHSVLRPVRLGQLPRVPDCSGEARRDRAGRLAGLLHVQQNRADQMHPVPAASQRDGIGARAAADIQQLGWRGGQQPVQQFHRPDVLQRRAPAGEQAGMFIAGAIVTFDRRINHHYRLPRKSPPWPLNFPRPGDVASGGGRSPHCSDDESAG